MRSVALLLLVAVSAFGQRVGAIRTGGFNTNAYARPNSYGSITGFGNVVYPGTGHAPIINNSITDTTFGARLGATVSGFPPYTGAPLGGHRGFRGGGRSVVYVPYAVGGYGYYPGYAEPEPQVTYVYQQPPQQVPPQVIINQHFTSETARPIVREYVSEPDGGIRVYGPDPKASTPAPEENPTYLIAFKDHTIYAALAYWVEGHTLHYVTSQNTHNQVSLDLVDYELSNRLNRERNVEFKLPPAK